MKYEPNHVLLRAAYQDTRHGLIDSERIKAFLVNAQANITVKNLDRISPLSVPTILQLGRETLSKNERDKFIFEDIEEHILKEAEVANID
jgi:ATP-dependent Lhr-like helicase